MKRHHTSLSDEPDYLASCIPLIIHRIEVYLLVHMVLSVVETVALHAQGEPTYPLLWNRFTSRLLIQAIV